MTDKLVQTYLGDISKSARAEDGTLFVTGTASDTATDNDGQVCDPSWLKSAMPDWFKWANIREQHSKIAAGVATELNISPDATSSIVAKVVDPTSAKKVEEGVLKGFSIGIKNPKIVKVAGDTAAPNGRIVGGQIIEVSLVDRPANANCKLQLAEKSESGSKIEPTEKLIEIDDETGKANYPSDPKLEACITKLVGDADMKKKHPDEQTRKSHAIAICRANFGKGVEDADIIKTSYLEALDVIEKADAGKPNPFAKKPDDKSKKKIDPKTGKEVDDEDDAMKLDDAVLEKLADGESHTFVRKDDGTIEIDGAAIAPEQPAPLTTNDLERLADLVADRVTSKTTEATKALEERVGKVEKAASGGGPVRMPGNTVSNGSGNAEASLITEADRLEKMAVEVQDNPALADGYRLLAKQKRDEAALLVKA